MKLPILLLSFAAGVASFGGNSGKTVSPAKSPIQHLHASSTCTKCCCFAELPNCEISCRDIKEFDHGKFRQLVAEMRYRSFFEKIRGTLFGSRQQTTRASLEEMFTSIIDLQIYANNSCVKLCKIRDEVGIEVVPKLKEKEQLPDDSPSFPH